MKRFPDFYLRTKNNLLLYIKSPVFKKKGSTKNISQYPIWILYFYFLFPFCCLSNFLFPCWSTRFHATWQLGSVINWHITNFLAWCCKTLLRYYIHFEAWSNIASRKCLSLLQACISDICKKYHLSQRERIDRKQPMTMW